jgi:hypothetical protein
VSDQEIKQEETSPEIKEEVKEEQRVDTREAEAEDPNSRLALDLYNSLQDPAKAKDVVKYLAAKAGLQVQEEDSSPKQAIKQTLADLKEGIPNEMHFLVDGLKPAIEKIVSKAIEDTVTPLKQAQLQDKEQLVMGQINTAYDTMRAKHKDFDKYENRMNKLSEDFAYRPGTDMTKYLDGLYKLATMETKEGEAVSHAVNKINKNAQRVNLQSAETSEGTVQPGSKLPTLREAVLAGVKGVRLQ